MKYDDHDHDYYHNYYLRDGANGVSNDYNDHYIGINHIMLILTMMLHMFCMLNYLKTFSTFAWFIQML